MATPYESSSRNSYAGSGSPEADMNAREAHPTQRKRLQLKPRSKQGASEEVVRPRRQRQSSAKGNPFGAALPREQVLKSRGIDASVMDDRIEEKSHVSHYTVEQEAEIEGVRVALTKAEKELRDANENELPEASFRVSVDAKRKELTALMAKYSEGTTTGAGEGTRSASERFSEPHGGRSSYRGAREQGNNNNTHYSGGGGVQQDRDDDDNAVFASFSSSSRRRRQHGDYPATGL